MNPITLTWKYFYTELLWVVQQYLCLRWFDVYYAISYQQSAGTDKAAVDGYSGSFSSQQLHTG